MKKLLIVMAALISNQVFAEVCHYNYKKENSTLTWTAFKTPKKVGVNVNFNSFDIKTKMASDINSVINGATFTVDTFSVDSKNPERDAKLKKHFFNTEKQNTDIQGKVLSIKDNVAQVEFNINRKKKVVPMNIAMLETEATITGKIDVLDFALNSNLSAINEACKVLHEGKTWSDVDLTLKAQFVKTCK